MCYYWGGNRNKLYVVNNGFKNPELEAWNTDKIYKTVRGYVPTPSLVSTPACQYVTLYGTEVSK
jgi:hypothetical protein